MGSGSFVGSGVTSGVGSGCVLSAVGIGSAVGSGAAVGVYSGCAISAARKLKNISVFIMAVYAVQLTKSCHYSSALGIK